jgi:hypothetical protein
MSSTALLSFGQKVTHESVKSQWLKFNVEGGFDVHTSQSMLKPKARFFSVCYNAPVKGWKSAMDTCRAHVKAVGDSPDDMYITSVDLTHTCSPTGDNHRKRNYFTRDISKLSEAIRVWELAKAGSSKQFAKIAKTSTGVNVKRGQAANAVKDRAHDQVEVHFGQFFWLPSLFAAYKEGDPDGTYVLEWTPCHWNQSLKQFSRAYACFSIAKHFWNHAVIKLAICDGTFTRSTCFKHTILVCTTFDPNNQITVLAVAIVDCENSDNWVWFKELLEDDFPGITVWMSDADKGIRSNAFSLSMSQSDDSFVLSRCARHLAENCRESVGGVMNEDHKRMIVELAKSLNEEVYQQRLGELQKINKKWVAYLDERKDQFVSSTFLDRGVNRWGKVTNNGVEVMNGVLAEARTLPIVSFFEYVLQYQRQKYQERHDLGCKWSEEGKQATEYLRLQQHKLAESASKLQVSIIERNDPIYRARVQVMQLVFPPLLLDTSKSWWTLKDDGAYVHVGIKTNLVSIAATLRLYY